MTLQGCNLQRRIQQLLATGLILAGLILPTQAQQLQPQQFLQAQQPQQPQPFVATYKANYSGISITATRSLRQINEQQQELRFSAKSWLAQIEEVSQFSWSDSGQLIPHQYRYDRTGLGRDRHALLDFNWQQNTVINNVENKPWAMKLPLKTQDKLSYQLQLRHDLNHQHKDIAYDVADGGKLKRYHFEVIGEEILSTQVGKLNTVKVKRTRKSNKRTTYLWLAKDWDHLVVKIQQREKGGKHYEIDLASAELNGTPVTGL